MRVIRNVDDVVRLLDNSKRFNIEYYTDGEGKISGCKKVACSNCCFDRVQDIEGCFSCMSRLSKEDICCATDIVKFIEFFIEETQFFWRS